MCRPRDNHVESTGTSVQSPESFIDYRRREYLRQQELGEQYRKDGNEYMSRFCSESILGATVLLGFIANWIPGYKASPPPCSMMSAVSVGAWSSILLSIFSGMVYLAVSVPFYRRYAKLFEDYCDEINRCNSIPEMKEKYDKLFGNARKSEGDWLLVAQGVLFALGTVGLTMALFLK